MLSDRESVKFYLVLWHGKIQTHKPNTSRASGRACMLRAWHGIHNAGGEDGGGGRRRRRGGVRSVRRQSLDFVVWHARLNIERKLLLARAVGPGCSVGPLHASASASIDGASTQLTPGRRIRSTSTSEPPPGPLDSDGCCWVRRESQAHQNLPRQSPQKENELLPPLLASQLGSLH
jgi:hypothetical protein